ncbi:MAG TPA: indole-3-glycerol phosphate synthase TrpC [Candidatus Methylomirabilis sp.]|nr:indole-3-glycerol phosphate synthase TrpC [Candidatus Methylomirabilis sp.]HSC69922.1 indole-3-glycerol phosphate synthase TrpC [Candidatus Methylomirabilis sp.]
MSFLDKILTQTRADLMERRARVPLDELKAHCRDQGPPRDFLGAVGRLRGEVQSAGPLVPSERRRGGIKVIAEVKRASPSKGVIRADFAPAELARAYAKGGAHAISVLTDAPFFQGSLAHLTAVRSVVDLPILRKDFHVDPYQIWEARATGADAVLLIAATQEPSQLAGLLGLSRELGLTALVEVHTAGELEIALRSGADLVGVNNRDLKTFEVSLETTFSLLPLVPPEVVLVSESGISRRDEVVRLAAAGLDGILVGEGLLRHADAGQALRDLMGAA